MRRMYMQSEDAASVSLKATLLHVLTSKQQVVSGEQCGGLHLDHDITLEVILKALELKLQDRRKVIEEHPFACILQQ